MVSSYDLICVQLHFLSLRLCQIPRHISLRGHWSLPEFCVTRCCFVMLRGAKCNGRHAVSG